MTQEEYLQLIEEVNSNKRFTQINYPLQGRKEIDILNKKSSNWELFSSITSYTNDVLKDYLKDFKKSFSNLGGSHLDFFLKKGELEIHIVFESGDHYETEEEFIEVLKETRENNNVVVCFLGENERSAICGNLKEGELEDDLNYILSITEGQFLNPGDNYLSFGSGYSIELHGIPFGAESIFDFSNVPFYAWGETETKDSYELENYEGPTVAEGEELPSYYDVISVKRGPYWKMPDDDAFQAIIQNCNYEWTTVNGTLGIKFTPKQNQNEVVGKYLFIPALQSTDSRYVKERYCTYWTRNSDEDRETAAHIFYADEITNPDIASAGRYNGMPILPLYVHDIK